MTYLDDLKEEILTNGTLDPEDLHHEFASGMHGRKIDFDLNITGGEFYEQWMDACAKYIQENYDEQPDMILGVANGANRMAISIVSRLPGKVLGITTEKETPKSVILTKVSEDLIASYKPSFVLVIEDVGTAGTTSATAAVAALKAGAKKVSVLNTWQRRAHLEKLEEAGIVHDAMIKEFLPTYTPEECEYCKNNIKFIPHD